jgi:integrase
VEERLLHANPCKAHTIKRRPVSPVANIVIWPRKRVDAIERHIDAPFRPAVVIGAGCGLRQGDFRKAGLDYRKRADGMHALRHFYASVLFSQGVSIKELAAYIGHNDPGFTLRTYTHLVPSSFERARTAVDAVFSATGPATDGLQMA